MAKFIKFVLNYFLELFDVIMGGINVHLITIERLCPLKKCFALGIGKVFELKP